MKVTFRCGSCLRLLQSTTTYSWFKIECPYCKKLVEVPVTSTAWYEIPTYVEPALGKINKNPIVIKNK